MIAARNHEIPETENDHEEDASVEVFDSIEVAGHANILLVDDREDKRLAMEAVLSDLGENVVQAASGKEALRKLLEREFAVILLDVNMPGMDGFETATLIRQRRSSEHTPIIFVTAFDNTETHVSRGYSLGAVDYVLTPVMPEVLRTKVSVFVELFKKSELLKLHADRLRRNRDELEMRVRQRTLELGVANAALKDEVGERQQAETEIRRLNANLEQRIQERTSQLGTANQELEAFTYSVAHDLEAPLRHLQSYSEMLNQEFAVRLPPEARLYLERIWQRARHMGVMLEELLKLSLVGKKDLVRSEVDLNELVAQMVESFKQDNPARKIDWRVGDLPRANCDPGLIALVFSNLLSNAVSDTRPRNPAIIEIGCQAGQKVRTIFVRDNGVGYDMRSADRLFGVFQRLHRAEDFEGTGIGLAISSRIVHRHGGRIWGESEPDLGATFFFTLEEPAGIVPEAMPPDKA